jgi:predicted ATPase
VLATSRTPLGVPGECLHPTAPLPVPQPDADPARSPAVRLFLDRARAVRPDLDLGAENLAHIGEVCRRLDGLPLSLELAAARIRSLNPADLAARIGDPFRLLVAPRSTVAPRHRTLRSVVDWSYALLTPAEQRLLARLSVFVGGFTLAAAEQVGADDEQVCADDGLVDLLAALVDNSLVTVGSTAGQVRYAMLETLRAYGGELLAARGDVATMRRAHARYYAAFAGRADRGLRGPDEAIWTRVLDADYDNLRAAHRWAMENADADAALRLSAGLYYYVLYQFRDETVSWAQAAIMLPDAEAHELYTTVCGAVGEGLTLRGEIGQARLLAERALTRITDPDDRRRVPLLKLMTAVTLYEGHLDDCFAWAAEHLRLARRYDDAAYVAEALLFQGLSRTYAGDPAGGLAIADENLGVATAIGNPNLTAWARYGQAEALAHADPDTAVHRYRQAIALAETARSPFTVTIAEVGLAALLARSGDTGDALRAFRRTVDRWYRMQVWHHQWTTLRNLGRLLVRIRAHEEATVLLAAVDAAGSAAFGADADDAAHAADVLQGALGAGAYAAATARGAAMDADGTVAFALATIDRILPRSSAESHSSADSEQ